MARRPIVFVSVFLIALCFCAPVPLHAQVPRPASFRAEHYDVSASLDSIGQSITATAKIDFKAVEAASSVRVELHPTLIFALQWWPLPSASSCLASPSQARTRLTMSAGKFAQQHVFRSAVSIS